MTTHYRFNTGGKNYGYGKQIGYAVKNILKDKYGEGKYATRAAHEARFKHFTDNLKSEGVKDLKKIDKDIIKKFGQTLIKHVNENKMSVAYAQNLLSTINVLMSHARGDNTLAVSPASLVGNRTHIRTGAPKSLDRQMIKDAVSKMTDSRARVSVQLAREFGLRFKETALLNLNRAIKEATTLGQINIVDGTKGGRRADRWVPVSLKQLTILKEAKQVAGKYKNLVGKTGSFKRWQNRFSAEYRNSGAGEQLGKFHDLRAAYACERYQQLTGKPAPVITGGRTASYQADQSARAILSLELGHHRIDVLNSYIGSASNE